MQTNAIHNNKFSTYALLAMRILLVLIFLYHGVPKAIFWSAATEKFIGFGLPGFLGPITGIAEVIASVLLLFGGKRLKNLGSDLGSAIKGFKNTMGEDNKDDKTTSIDNKKDDQ